MVLVGPGPNFCINPGGGDETVKSTDPVNGIGGAGGPSFEKTVISGDPINSTNGIGRARAQVLHYAPSAGIKRGSTIPINGIGFDSPGDTCGTDVTDYSHIGCKLFC